MSPKIAPSSPNFRLHVPESSRFKQTFELLESYSISVVSIFGWYMSVSQNTSGGSSPS